MLQGLAVDHLATLLATRVGRGPQKMAFLLDGLAEDKHSVVIAAVIVWGQTGCCGGYTWVGWGPQKWLDVATCVV